MPPSHTAARVTLAALLVAVLLTVGAVTATGAAPARVRAGAEATWRAVQRVWGTVDPVRNVMLGVPGKVGGR